MQGVGDRMVALEKGARAGPSRGTAIVLQRQEAAVVPLNSRLLHLSKLWLRPCKEKLWNWKKQLEEEKDQVKNLQIALTEKLHVKAVHEEAPPTGYLPP